MKYFLFDTFGVFDFASGWLLFRVVKLPFADFGGFIWWKRSVYLWVVGRLPVGS